jgi:hypothetical protein
VTINTISPHTLTRAHVHSQHPVFLGVAGLLLLKFLKDAPLFSVMVAGLGYCFVEQSKVNGVLQKMLMFDCVFIFCFECVFFFLCLDDYRWQGRKNYGRCATRSLQGLSGRR